MKSARFLSVPTPCEAFNVALCCGDKMADDPLLPPPKCLTAMLAYYWLQCRIIRPIRGWEGLSFEEGGGAKLAFFCFHILLEKERLLMTNRPEHCGTVDFNHKKFKLIDSKVKQAELGARENFRDNATMSRSRKIVALSLIFRKLSRCR